MSQNLSEAVEFIANELEKECREFETEVEVICMNYVRMMRLAVIMAKPIPVAPPADKCCHDEFYYDLVKKCYIPKNTKESSDAVS